MQVPASMVLVATLIVAAGVAVVSPVSAEPAMTNAAYMQAARCAGLAQGADLNTGHVDALLTARASSQGSAVLDESDEMRADAQDQVHRARAAGRRRLEAELNGVCQTYLGRTSQSASASSGGAGG